MLSPHITQYYIQPQKRTLDNVQISANRVPQISLLSLTVASTKIVCSTSAHDADSSKNINDDISSFDCAVYTKKLGPHQNI